ncbi:VanZF family protein [Lachnospiraceae bacterium KM106-2]|nr:VanZF family protein [Lachnospiraceae bacterium KM106-2]
MNRYIRYIITGVWQLKSALLLSIILYGCIVAVWYIVKKKHTDQKRNLHIGRMILAYLLLLYLLTILKITGIIGMQFHLSWFVDAIQHFRIGLPFVGSSILMLLLNFLLFVPFGFLLSLVFEGRNRNTRNSLLLGLATSFIIEFLQLFGGRMFELDDLIMNTLGTEMGYQIWSSIHGMRTEKAKIKYAMRGVICIISVGVFFFGLFFIADGDATQDRESSMYSEMASSDEEIADVSEGVLYLDGAKKKIGDKSSCYYLYRMIGESISNHASFYSTKTGTYQLKNLVNKSKVQYIEISLKHSYDYTFYNNHNLKLENVNHILYDPEHGTLYYGNKEDKEFSHALIYENKENPFETDKQMMEEIKQVK